MQREKNLDGRSPELKKTVSAHKQNWLQYVCML